MDADDARSSRERFAHVVRGDPLPLDLACLLISSHCGQHDTDVEAARDRLDELAAALPEPSLDGLVGLLFHDLGFAGEREVYYDPDNSYLDLVLERRTGIPITLSVLAIEVGRRAGVPLFGIGMPGHFLVGHRGDDDVFIDAFGGTVIDAAGAQELFESMQPGVAFERSYLAETPPQVIVLRMLNNLRMIHHHSRNSTALASVLELLVCLDDCPLDEYRQLATALERRGRVDDAARYLEQAADRYGGTDADQLRAAARRLWARLN